MADNTDQKPGTPLSPLSIGRLAGLNVPYQQPPPEDIELEPRDAEALEPKPRRKSVFSRLYNFPSYLSRTIPAHWKAGNINKHRINRPVEHHPNGFPRFAAWMNCDENFLLARRYGWLHNRVIMFRQSELHELEQELVDTDKKLEDTKDTDALTGHYSFASGPAGAKRKKLIEAIDDKLAEYDSIIMRAKEMASLPKATRRNYASVCNHLFNHQPIAQRERDLFMHDVDFVALVQQDESKAIDGFVEDLLTMLPYRRLTKFIFANAEQRAMSTNPYLLLYDKHRIDIFIRIVMAVLAVALLLAPVVVLFFRDQDTGTTKIIVILVFTLGFSLALSMATKAKRAEVFAATAAYCAVLVVFLGNFVPTSTVALPSTSSSS